MGRPKKETERTGRSAGEADVGRITREERVKEKVDRGRKDSSGHKSCENGPVINKRGEQVKYTEYLVPPTVGGLCEYLEIHRSTWAEYCDESLHPEFSDTTTRTRGRMREYLEQQLLIRKDVKGIIFSLQNNYGYTERREVDFGPQASRALTASAVPMAEREALLRELFQEFSQEGAAPDGAGET